MALRKCGTRHIDLDNTIYSLTGHPLVGQGNRGQASLPAQNMMCRITGDATVSMKDHPPGPVMGLDHIRMIPPLMGLPLTGCVGMGQNGVC